MIIHSPPFTCEWPDRASHALSAKAMALSLSIYAAGLEPVAFTRYTSKIAVIKEDPYLIPKEDKKSVVSCTIDEMPDLAYPDIYNYVVNSPSGINGSTEGLQKFGCV